MYRIGLDLHYYVPNRALKEEIDGERHAEPGAPLTSIGSIYRFGLTPYPAPKEEIDGERGLCAQVFGLASAVDECAHLRHRDRSAFPISTPSIIAPTVSALSTPSPTFGIFIRAFPISAFPICAFSISASSLNNPSTTPSK
ncbi:uncharacterized protein B0T23DRAFT_391514 [Neurospora hispaniola]|uniref:Uncharacterized protein n=1 Tax=Neurospora hispaniola TaxID=588809 RepID=A0AAJ0MUK5_9PEZI|nr:hypothetical protein B0T23DRAFT_391514 [Neurospora hispaniola]